MSDSLYNLMNKYYCLIAERKFVKINNMLKNTSYKKEDTDILVAKARITFSIRSLLPFWKEYVRLVNLELQSRKLDNKRIMQGLI